MTAMARARKPTFVRGLDETLEGGIPEGHIVLLAGAPGTMKSSLAFSILYQNALHNGDRGLYLTLEQSKTSLVEHLETMGMDEPSAYEMLSIFDMAMLRKNLSFMAEGSWITLFKGYVKNLMEMDPYRFVVIDSMNVLETMAGFGERRTELFYLFEWLKELEATVLLLLETREGASQGGELDEAYLADGVFQLDLYPVSDLDVQRRLRCVKLRAVNHDMSSFALVWNGDTFEITRAVSVGRRASPEAR